MKDEWVFWVVILVILDCGFSLIIWFSVSFGGFIRIFDGFSFQTGVICFELNRFLGSILVINYILDVIISATELYADTKKSLKRTGWEMLRL